MAFSDGGGSVLVRRLLCGSDDGSCLREFSCVCGGQGQAWKIFLLRQTGIVPVSAGADKKYRGSLGGVRPVV